MPSVAAVLAIDREQMILSHMPQVKLIAKSFYRRCPPGVLLEDLVSVGTVGLIQAVDRFDPDRNLKLKTIAEHRIRGAMLDYLRQIDPLPRTIRQFARQRDEALRRVENRLGRVPSDDEVAAELEVPLPKYRLMILAIHASSTVSLDTVARPDNQPFQVPGPPIRMEDVDSIRRLRVAIGNLSGREARVAMAICEGQSPRELASQLGVSESYVTLLKARAIRQLRVSLPIPVVPRRIGDRTCSE